MKLFYVIYVAYVAVLTVATAVSESDERTKDMLLRIEICQNEHNVSETELKEMDHGPKTEKDKCFVACLMKKSGVMDETNKLVPGNVEKTVLDDTIKSTDGKILKSMIKEIAQACESVSDEDKCEAADKILICLKAEAGKRGFAKFYY